MAFCMEQHVVRIDKQVDSKDIFALLLTEFPYSFTWDYQRIDFRIFKVGCFPLFRISYDGITLAEAIPILLHGEECYFLGYAVATAAHLKHSKIAPYFSSRVSDCLEINKEDFDSLVEYALFLYGLQVST